MKKFFTLLLLASFVLGASAQKRNLIANSRFEDNYKNWRTDGSPLSNVATNAIIYDIDSITPISGKKSAKITINAAPSGNVWDRALVYYLPVTKDAQYLVHLKVKASGTNSLNIEYGMNHSGWNQALVKANYPLTGDGTTLNEIVIKAVADVEGTVDPITASCDWQFKFNLGKQPNGAIIWIDDISVTRINGNWDGNLVPQGDFENVAAGWNGWFDVWNNGVCATTDINSENKINGKSLHMLKTSTSSNYKATELSFFYWENELADYEISGDIVAADGSTLGSAYFVTFMSNPNGNHLESTPILAKAVPSSATGVIDHFTISKDNTDSATYHQSSYSSTWRGMIKAYLGFGSGVMPVGYEAYLDNLTVKEKITLKGIEIDADSIITKDTTLAIWANPTNADNSVFWSVTNGTGTATIDTNGKLHPVCNGTVIVTATSKINGSIAALKTFSVVKPVIQSSNISFFDVKRSSLNVSFTAGNGSKRAIFIAAGTTGSPAPDNNKEYIVGEQIGTTGWYCKYVGNSNASIINDLSPSTTYRVKVSDYEICSSSVRYTLADTLLNPNNVTTTSTYLPQTITFDSITIKGQLVADFDPLAVASSGLDVTYASSNSSVATILNGKVHIVGVGTSIITASQSGDDDYSAADPIQRVLLVKNKSNQTIAFDSLASKPIGSEPFKLTANANSGLTVSYKSSNPSVAKISNDTVFIVSPGITIISAYQPGDADYYPSDTVKQSFTVNATEIWISTNGSDSNIGTKDLPLATLSKAILKARELRQSNDPSIAGGIHIILKGGTYQLSETVVLNQKDAGTAASPTFIEAAPGETPIISGGVNVSGWQDAGFVSGLPNIAQNRIWVANTPQIAGANLNFRQLYVNNVKVNRTSSKESINRLISADKSAQTIQIPTPRMPVKNAKNMELTVIQDWELANLRIKSIDSLGLKTQFTFQQPESGIEFKRPWPSLVATDGNPYNQFFFLSNAIELLNRPLEWHNDSITGKLYYWPRAGQDKATVKVIAPALETLIKIEGTLDSTVSYIKFKGINFEHTTWMRPSYAGHIPLQSGQYILDAYSITNGNVAWVGRQPAGVMVKGASHINFDGCTFQHMGANGLDFVSGTHNDSVQGCIFTDIGGSGIQIGYFGDENFEVHKAYNPTDNREVCQFEVIKNNYITNVTTEDWGCIGVSVGYASDVTISHNEIGNVNYAAISVGWGWTGTANCMKNNKIIANYIHNFANNMQDVGAIYTLSTQPNSQMTGNRIEKMGDPIYNANRWAFCIYLDEGTDYYNVSNNWTDKSSINTNKIGSHVVWGTNGPSVSDTYKLAAGLETGYQNLLLKVHVPSVPPADSIVEYVDCYTPLYATGNLVSDPECTTLTNFKNWGNVAIISDGNAYCGTSVQATGTCGGSIDYSLTGNLIKNTAYRLRAMMFTSGNAGITLNGCGINGSTADYQKTVNTGSTWQLIDFVFTTGSLASAQNFWFNSCGENKATDIRLDNFEIFPDTVTAIPVALSELIKVYPNPVTSTLFVEGNGITDISILSIEGVQLQKHGVSGNAIDMSQLPSGIYLVKIATSSGIFVKSVLKK